MMNLVSVDSQRLMNFIWNPHDWWSGPLAIIINLGVLFWLVSYSALAGMTTLFLLGGPLNYYLTRLAVRYEEALISVADDRINHINEILLGMRFLKLYNWEDCFKDRANKVGSLAVSLLTRIGERQ
jgi:ATP-binding cassette subfamily C (CFTR/MRP) protein 1